jgi:histone acetyltransferase (RNA polymerase elongator complex component)
MAVAEHVSHGLGFESIAVISGVGVRSYYAKLGCAPAHGAPLAKPLAPQPLRRPARPAGGG